MGIGNALLSEISFKAAGSSSQISTTTSRAHERRAARHPRAPYRVGFGVPLGGVDEPWRAADRAGLCNAIFAATGKRIRQLPIAGSAILH